MTNIIKFDYDLPKSFGLISFPTFDALHKLRKASSKNAEKSGIFLKRKLILPH